MRLTIGIGLRASLKPAEAWRAEPPVNRSYGTTAILLAREGAKVTIAEIDPRAGEETAYLAGDFM